MFIYSKYSNYGNDESEKLVHMLANDGIKAICLIDEFGLGVHSFLKACAKRRVSISIAIPFISFVEGLAEKQQGYLVANTYTSYEYAFSLINVIKKDFIPLLTAKDIEELSDRGVYCLIRDGQKCYEYTLRTRITILPIVSEKEIDRKENLMSNRELTGISMQENYFIPETIIFVEGVSKKPDIFLQRFEDGNKYIDFNTYKEKQKLLRKKG
jgi:hypothetical protein